MNVPDPRLKNQLVRDQSYPAPVDLAHFSLVSGSNYRAMLRFYQVVLNMRIVYEIRNKITFTALSFDEENHRIGLVEVPQLSERPSNGVRIEHSSWRYRSLPDLLATVRQIEGELGLFPAAVHQGKIIALSYRDPDGNRCEIFCECMTSQAELIDFYVNKLAEKPEFNTLMPFDLRAMLAREAAGEPLEHLQDYDWVEQNLHA
jgi:catechol 2,3-dioxygenase-like lactoylglutathione lyase family enzyme